MNIDERLAALTQTVELMAAMQRDNEARSARIDERQQALAQTVEIIAGMQQANETRLAQVMEAINGLARIAESHEHRLSRLEGDTQ